MTPHPADLLAPDALAGQVALVTGGGSGIGRACAIDLAGRGAAVVVCGRRAEPLAEVRREIEEAGGRCLAVTADLREQPDVDRVVDAALAEYGAVDVLVSSGESAPPLETER